MASFHEASIVCFYWDDAFFVILLTKISGGRQGRRVIPNTWQKPVKKMKNFVD